MLQQIVEKMASDFYIVFFPPRGNTEECRNLYTPAKKLWGLWAGWALRPEIRAVRAIGFVFYAFYAFHQRMQLTTDTNMCKYAAARLSSEGNHILNPILTSQHVVVAGSVQNQARNWPFRSMLFRWCDGHPKVKREEAGQSRQRAGPADGGWTHIILLKCW